MGENENKPKESENASSAGEKEHKNKTASNIETAINNDTKTGNDKVRELLGQSKMTPEERERKRKELIEKQKKALQRAEETRSRVSNEVDTDATQSTQQPRENLILQAVKFLSSPRVRNADEEKKIKFLLNKGLTRAEIDIAKSRVDKEQLSAPQDANSQVNSVKIAQSPTDPQLVPPPVPPRTYQMVVTRAPLWKHVILVLLVTGAFGAAMIAVIKKFLGPAVTAIIFAKQQLYFHQLNLFRRFNESLSTILSLRKSSKPAVRSNIDDDDESPTPYEIDTPPTLLAPLATDLSELTEKLSNHQKSLTKYDTIPDLQLSLTSLATYLSSSVYTYSPWSSSDSSASQVRSEIRGLKGMLISRRNFPKIPPVPAYSAQSQQSPSQLQQQQVNTSNEDIFG